MAREDIRLEIIGDIKAYAKAVAKIPGVTEKEAEKAAKAFVKSQQRAQIRSALEAEKAAKKGAKSWSDAGLEAAKGFAAGFAVVGGLVGTVGAFVDKLAETRLEIEGLSRATGIGLDTLSGIATAADLAGKEFDDVAGGLEDFGEKMFDASRGSGAALEAFELLGFSQKELKARLDDTDGVLRESIELMQGTENAALKNTVAQQLWGDQGNRLIEVMGDIPLEDFIAQADRLGTEVTPENVRQSRQWRASLSALKGEFTATGNAAVEFVDVSQSLEDVALAMVFLKNVGVASFTALRESWRTVSEGIVSFVKGDFQEAIRLLDEGTGFDALSTALANVKESVNADTQAFIDLREITKSVGTETRKTATELSELSEDAEDAAKAADEFRKQNEKLAKQQKTAADALRAIQTSLTADTLNSEGKILRARDAQIAKIEEIQDGLAELLRAGVDVADEIAASQIASTEAVARAERDLAALRADQAVERAEVLNRFAELREEGAERAREQEIADHQARVDRTLQAIDIVSEFQQIAFSGLTELSRRGQDATRDALQEQKNANRDIRTERRELKDQLLEDISEEEAAAIQARINELDSELAVGKKRRKERKKSALKAWNASRALALSDVAFNTSAAVLKAFALFGPPPSPVGIGSAAAAGTNAAIQTGLILSEKPPQFHDGRDGRFPVFTGGPDEQVATLRAGEPVLNARAADRLGRENIQSLNGTGDMAGGGGDRVMGLFLDRRQVGDVVTRTLDVGGQLSHKIRSMTQTQTRPMGQVSVFSTSR